MNRSIVVLSAAIALIAATLSAQPRGPRDGRGPGSGPGPMAGMNLTEEQSAKMADLRVAHLKEVESLRADLAKQQSALRLELTAEKFNEARARSIQAEVTKLQNELGWKRVAHQRAVRDLLTPDQQKRFDARVLSGGPGRPGRMGGDHPGMMQRGGGFGMRHRQN